MAWLTAEHHKEKTTHMTPTLLKQIDGLRQQGLTLLDQLMDRAATFELPAPPEALGQFRQKLQENRYQVLVVGEAKRGKSSFINALIGRAILPTDVDIATSQVFLVNQAAQEACRIRFEDGSTEEISAADLPRYGSQVLADLEGTPRLDQIIRWIEVDAPARFLPDGVSLLDTPGLGSLYARHGEITQRFIPQADAVIYVLDSGQPIGQADLDSIAAILEVTGSLFFIQTRIDQFRKEQWQALQARNEQILHERFADKLADARVWPISSTNLMKAAETQDADYEIVSRHRELAAALKTFLFRVAGLSRVAAAMAVADHYYGNARQVLLGRAADLADQSKERRTQVREQIAQRKQTFDRAWGEHGSKRQALMVGLQRAVTAGKQTLRQALDSGGQIDRAIHARIDQVTTLDEAHRLADTLAADVTEAAVTKWEEVDQQVRKYILDQLAPFVDAQEYLAQASYAGLDGAPPVRERYRLQTEDDQFERAKGGFFDLRNAALMAGLGGTVAVGLAAAATSTTLVATFLASAIFPPLAVGAAVWALMQGHKGWTRTAGVQLKRAQQELDKHLGDVRDQVRRYYFEVDLPARRLQSLVDEHFDQFMDLIGNYLQRIVHEQSEEASREPACLTEQAKLDEKQQATRLAELRGQLAQWDQVGQGIQGIIGELIGIEQTLAGLGQPPVEEPQA